MGILSTIGAIAFQFHKGTIKTWVTPVSGDDYFISIP